MAKAPYKIEFTLIVRNAEGTHINGTGSRGDLSYASRLAHSYLRTDRTTAASVDVYRYDPHMSWEALQKLSTVTLDDDLEGGKP